MADVRKRQAAIAKHMQEMALKAFEEHQPRNFSEALKCLQIGMQEEREALGINDNKKQAIYVEPPFMRTRYAQSLKNMSFEELSDALKELSEADNKILN